MKDKVSVITAFYNAEKYILQAIHSVNSQAIDDSFDIEYVLINDCSTDKSLDVINYYFSEMKNEKIDVKIIDTPENLGCGGARKFGIDNSTGNFLMFLDADDYYINNDFIKRAHEDILSLDADIVEYGLSTVNENYQQIFFNSPNKIIIEDNPFVVMSYLFNKNLIKFMPWTKITRRSLTETKQYDVSRTYEDIKTTPYWLYNAKKVAIMNTIEIRYRYNKESIIRKNSEEMRLGTCDALLSLFEFFKDNNKILRLIYERAFIDLSTLTNYNSNYEYFNKLSQINTKMLQYIYPETYMNVTYNIENSKIENVSTE